jgi:hypothetical protein
MRPARGAVALSAQFKNFNRPGLICPCAHTIHNRISDTPGWGELEGTGDQITKEAAGGGLFFYALSDLGCRGMGKPLNLLYVTAVPIKRNSALSDNPLCLSIT